MSRDFIPHICGDSNIYIPDKECTDCDKLAKRVKDLEDTRLIQSDIKAGHHISVDYEEDNNEVIINADLSNYYTQSQVDALIASIGAYDEVEELPETGDRNKIYLVPLQGGGYERWIYTDDGWRNLGSTQMTIDKTTILTALGYRETTFRMIDTEDNEVEVAVLVADV